MDLVSDPDLMLKAELEKNERLEKALVRIPWFRLLDTAELSPDERRAIATIVEAIGYGEHYRRAQHV